MKLILLMAVLLLNSGASMALNVNIGYPVEASRMSLYGETTASVDCKNKTVEILDSSNVIFDRHIRKHKNVMCYGDDKSYTIKFMWERGSKPYRYDMIASQTSRYQPEINAIVK